MPAGSDGSPARFRGRCSPSGWFDPARHGNWFRRDCHGFVKRDGEREKAGGESRQGQALTVGRADELAGAHEVRVRLAHVVLEAELAEEVLRPAVLRLV